MAARSKRRHRCQACRGTGYEGCSSCGGSGRRNVRKRDWRKRGPAAGTDPENEPTSTECEKCRGTGHGAKCPMCKDGWRTS